MAYYMLRGGGDMKNIIRFPNDKDMDEFLKEQLIKDADEYEKELDSKPHLRDVTAPDDLFGRIKEQIRYREEE